MKHIHRKGNLLSAHNTVIKPIIHRTFTFRISLWLNRFDNETETIKATIHGFAAFRFSHFGIDTSAFADILSILQILTERHLGLFLARIWYWYLRGL
ncbi:hypothetical protein [Deefgea piscis]|uniref:hypothetical protein n=1 Tax=Deefgea piscis TaxID=2739061 RepID=UPI001C820A5F|nr:hypothetical protein [Deefgea piscis]QZA79669.1 hypothetical protein K4H25_08835 [Deefgea piscis]